MSTPAAYPNTNLVTTDTDSINQFLGTHVIAPVYEGVAQFGPAVQGVAYPAVTVYPLTGVSNITRFDQPFTIHSGTTVSRIEIPFVMNRVPWADFFDDSFSVNVGANYQDVLVQVYTDSGGVPNTLLQTMVIPADFFAALAAGGQSFPDQNTQYIGTYTTPASLQPPAPYETYSNIGVASDGISIVLVGGAKAGVPDNAVFSAVMQSGGTLSTWTVQPPYPVAIWLAGTVAANGYVVVTGGNLASGANTATVYTSPLNPAGALGGWLAQEALPSAICGHEMVTDGNGHVYAIGGSSSGTSTPTKTVYMASINAANGVIASWSTLNPLPVALEEPNATFINGWIVVASGTRAGGLDGFATYAAPVNADGTLGTWQPWFTSGYTTTVLAVTASIGGSLIMLSQPGAFEGHVLGVGPSGPARRGWAFQPVPPSVNMYGTNVAVMANVVPPQVFIPNGGGIPGATFPVYPVTVVSVPFTLTGLATATTYHCVITGIAPAQSTGGVGVPLQQDPAFGSIYPLAMLFTGTWNPQSAGTSIPIAVYSGTNGRLVHTVQDASAGLNSPWSWMITDWSGKIIAYAEYQNNVRSWRNWSYDAFGTLVSLT